METQQRIWNARYKSGKMFESQTSWLFPYISLLRGFEGVPQVLEVGCGDGRCSEYLKGCGFDVVASDISNVAINNLAERSSDIKCECFDISQGIPHEKRSFDLVLSNLSSHYFSTEETRDIYTDVWRVLKPGGYFLLRVNDRREYDTNKVGDTVETLGVNFVLSRNGKRKHYFDHDDLKSCLGDFNIISMKDVSFPCNGREKYAIEALARKDTRDA